MPPRTKKEQLVLSAIKAKGVNSLKQDIRVSLQDDSKLKIEMVTLSRTGSSGVQHNHVIPVDLLETDILPLMWCGAFSRLSRMAS